MGCFCFQEPNAEGDAQLCNSVNFYINQPIGMCFASPDFLY